MFGKKTDSQSSTTPVRSGNSSLHNSLVKGSKLEGNVSSSSDFRIDGSFEGNLSCEARVIIGPTGIFKGHIDCENAIIEGKFDGDLHIREVLEVREGAVIEGEVTTNRLVVQSGSVFDVNCSMGGKDIATSSIPRVSEAEDEAILTELENGQSK